jgi:hypothetical protein
MKGIIHGGHCYRNPEYLFTSGRIPVASGKGAHSDNENKHDNKKTYSFHVQLSLQKIKYMNLARPGTFKIWKLKS